MLILSAAVAFAAEPLCVPMTPLPSGPDYDRTWWSARKEARLSAIGAQQPVVAEPRTEPHVPSVLPVDKAAALVASAPWIAILGAGTSQHECSGMGGEHMVFEVLDVVRGDPIRHAHAGGHGVYGLFGSWSCDVYVAGLVPVITEDNRFCITEPRTDAEVVALVRAVDRDHADAVAAALLTWGTPAAVPVPAR